MLNSIQVRLAATFLAALLAFAPSLRASPPLHAEVLVFIPGYEASQLFDSNLESPAQGPVCVWGNYQTFFSSKRYFSLRQPNALVSKPLLAVGPIDIYQRFVTTLTHARNQSRGFSPYTLDADFFIFAYDWRQEIATHTAPLLARALEQYAIEHERKTGIPARETKFIIVSHSMGGLVARTLLSQKPAWASRVSRLYLVGTPNLGSVKAINTVVVGPDSIKGHSSGFPGVLLKALPSDVDQNVTKLVGITRPTLYELLPFGDPHWQVRQFDGRLSSVPPDDVLRSETWRPYWPSAELEKTLYLDGWLKDRWMEGRKQIVPAEWEFCQDRRLEKLNNILSRARAWRSKMGSLRQTRRLLTRPGESSRLRIILSDGVATPAGILTEGRHDASRASYNAFTNEGDGTVECRRVLDDLTAASPLVELLHGVRHQKLMIDPLFLKYLTRELSDRAPAKPR